MRQRPFAGGDVKNLAGILDRSPRRFGAKQGENRGSRRRITQVLECAANAVERNGRKKVLQIDVDEHLPSRVFNCVGANRPAFDETVRGRMSWQALKNVLEDPALGRGQLRCGADSSRTPPDFFGTVKRT